ncbi:MAG TPA: hypothetical protein DEP00_01125, partial [Lachnospiraceae bacterium]|nr:hypothetical protein [Lachnospiraceae bacterium]
EQGGVRPVVVLQNDQGNLCSPTVIAAAVTSKVGKKTWQPTHLTITNPNLPKDSVVLLEQIRTLDKKRLIEKVGSLSLVQVKEIDLKLSTSFGLDLNYEDVLNSLSRPKRGRKK